MPAINGPESGFAINQSQLSGKSNDTSSAIATHRTLAAITVEVDHGKVAFTVIPQQDHAIRPNPKSSVAKGLYCLGIMKIDLLLPIIDEDKVIARAMVFVEIASSFRLDCMLSQWPCMEPDRSYL